MYSYTIYTIITSPILNYICCPSVHHTIITKQTLDVIVLVTNFIQLVSPQPVDQFLQTKLWWKAPNDGYLHICEMYKSDNK